MAATQHLAKAAYRHRRCAQSLATRKEQAEAGYLVGLAAECAVKHYLQEVNFSLHRKRRVAKNPEKYERDPLLLHFPELASELLAQASGILAGRVLVRIRDPALLQGWNVKMRYRDQSSSPVVVRQYERWLEQTNQLFREVGL